MPADVQRDGGVYRPPTVRINTAGGRRGGLPVRGQFGGPVLRLSFQRSAARLIAEWPATTRLWMGRAGDIGDTLNLGPAGRTRKRDLPPDPISSNHRRGDLEFAAVVQMLTGSLVRLVVTVATLAAVYLFILRPVLDTTNDAIDKTVGPSSTIQRQISDAFDAAGVDEADAKIPSNPDLKRARKMLACVDRAAGDVEKLTACSSR